MSDYLIKMENIHIKVSVAIHIYIIYILYPLR